VSFALHTPLEVIAMANNNQQKLPRALLNHLLQWTDATSGLVLGRVCREWHKALCSEDAWRQTRTVPPQRIVPWMKSNRLCPDTLAANGPSFEWVWTFTEANVQEDTYCLDRLSHCRALRAVTIDSSDSCEHGEDDPAPIDFLKEYFQTPLPWVAWLHLRGQTIEWEEVGFDHIDLEVYSMGWLYAYDLENMLLLFPAVHTLTLSIEVIKETQKVKVMNLVATQIPCLTCLHIYDDPQPCVSFASSLSPLALLALYPCTTLVSLTLDVYMWTPHSFHYPEQHPRNPAALWPAFLASPLIASGRLQHLILWRDAVCCNKQEGSEEAAGLAQLPTHIQVHRAHRHLSSPPHLACLTRALVCGMQSCPPHTSTWTM
jgi:hypothetical protein